MSRRMTAPGVWLDEGAATARLHGQSTFGIHGASRVGDMRPVVSLPAVRTDAARVNDEKQRVVKAEKRQERPRCGVLLSYIKEPCARFAGHAMGNGDGHRSREALAIDAERRRTTLGQPHS